MRFFFGYLLGRYVLGPILWLGIVIAFWIWLLHDAHF